MDLIPKQYKSGNPAEKEGGLKSRGISIYDKESKLLFLLNKRVLVAWGAVLLALAILGGIKIYNFYAEKKIVSLEQEVKKLQSEQDVELAKKINEIDKSISAVKNLLKNHIYSSLFFVSLERLTIPQVQWTGVALDTLQGTADLKGKALNYTFLAKQIVSFEEGGFQVSVSGIKLERDGVGFSVKIKFDSKILLK